MATKHLIGAVFGLGVATLALGSPAAAENGVTADKIVFGQAAALDGPAGALGQGMRDGLLAAFAEANKAEAAMSRRPSTQRCRGQQRPAASSGTRWS